MAINVINAQGSQVYILSSAEADTITGAPANDIPIIQGGKLVGCPQSIGNIEQTRAVTEYKCMSNNESAKALGSIERGNVELGLLFDPTDTTGQDALKSAFAANTKVGIGIELPDTGGTSGTIFYFEGGISAVSVGIVQDEAVTYTVTVEISSDVTEYEATA